MVAVDAEVSVDHHDWRDRDATERAADLAAFLDRDRSRGFDLGSAPLLRLALFRESDTAYRCVWTHHHLILDGWSQQLVLADFLACYRALAAGERPRCPTGRPCPPTWTGSGPGTPPPTSGSGPDNSPD
ncbi:condensation domain-containing protein [Streptomyces sp. M19]